MKVFISWSGDLSRELAEALRDWLPAVIQNVKPFFTPNDIEKGARWGKDIAQQLEESAVGIFCLTKENLTKPWIMFEAGALSKQLDFSRVCPVLFGVDNADLEGPLVQFQASPFSETEMRKLIRTINSLLADNRLEDSVLNSVFEMWWPKLNEKVTKIFEKYASSVNSHSGTRSDRDILEEVLELSRLNASISKKGMRRSSFSLDDAKALQHALVNLKFLCDQFSEDNNTSHFKIISEIYFPLRNMVTAGEISHRHDVPFDQILWDIDSIMQTRL